MGGGRELVAGRAAAGGVLDGVMPGSADLYFIAVNAGEGFVGSLGEQGLARRDASGEGRVNEVGFAAGDAEEFPFRVGDLLDEGVLDVAGRRRRFVEQAMRCDWPPVSSSSAWNIPFTNKNEKGDPLPGPPYLRVKRSTQPG